jgi:hypothetical protein
MTVGLNAAQARANSQQDMIIFNEATSIMEAIIAASAAGEYETTVSDGTTMTESTPAVTVTGSVQNPVVVPGTTLIVNGSTVTLGASGTNLNAVIADINDAAITGVVASKSNGYLVLTVTLPASTTWQYTIGAGTANTAVGLSEGTYTASNPDSVGYFDAWQGTLTDRGLVNHMDAVIKHFRNLGFKIERISNTTTGRTFSWYVYW